MSASDSVHALPAGILVVGLFATDFATELPRFCPEDDSWGCETERSDTKNTLQGVALYCSIAAGIPLFLAVFGMVGSSKRSKSLLGATLFFTLAGLGVNILSFSTALHADPLIDRICSLEDSGMRCFFHPFYTRKQCDTNRVGLQRTNERSSTHSEARSS